MLRIRDEEYRVGCQRALIETFVEVGHRPDARRRAALFLKELGEDDPKNRDLWQAAIGHFPECNELDPWTWDRESVVALPGWVANVLVQALWENKNEDWDERVRKWSWRKQWEGPGEERVAWFGDLDLDLRSDYLRYCAIV